MSSPASPTLPSSTPRSVRFGTSSWSEKAWGGAFYPQGTKAGDFLTLYAEQFTAVEADVTYYRVPDAKLVDSWRAKTPEDFRLCAKFPRTIVHAGQGPRPDGDAVLVGAAARADTDRFLDSMARLGPRCGPLLLQFPYFNRTAFASPAPFLERLARYLDDLPKSFRYAVEIRNKQWLGPELLDLLRERGVALALVELLYMPHPAEVHARLDVRTADFAYTRLIGDRKRTEAAAERFDRVVLDKSESLNRWAELLKVLTEQVDEVFCFSNNHYAGFGPGTARDLEERVAALG